jgi:hypothetical protein
MAEQESDSTKTRGNLSDFLWPLGGTCFGLFVIRIAMAQYQTFFNQNEWLLPVSVIVTAACWIIPLLLHNRARRIYSAILAIRRGGAFLFAIIVIVAIAGLFFGGRTLLRSHLNHLRVLNQPMPPKNAPPPLVPPSGENTAKPDTSQVISGENIKKAAANRVHIVGETQSAAESIPSPVALPPAHGKLPSTYVQTFDGGKCPPEKNSPDPARGLFRNMENIHTECESTMNGSKVMIMQFSANNWSGVYISGITPAGFSNKSLKLTLRWFTEWGATDVSKDSVIWYVYRACGEEENMQLNLKAGAWIGQQPRMIITHTFDVDGCKPKERYLLKIARDAEMDKTPVNVGLREAEVDFR